MVTEKDDYELFKLFATLYPHEAYSEDPEKFWRFFQERCPGVSREVMEELLKGEG